MRDGNKPGEDIAERLLDFAARIGKTVDALPDTRMGRHIAGQLIRCGTAPAPNFFESRGAESRRDFVHKLSICLKELRESDCWLRLILRAELISAPRLDSLLDECQQLTHILAKSIVTAKKNSLNSKTP